MSVRWRRPAEVPGRLPQDHVPAWTIPANENQRSQGRVGRVFLSNPEMHPTKWVAHFAVEEAQQHLIILTEKERNNVLIRWTPSNHHALRHNVNRSPLCWNAASPRKCPSRLLVCYHPIESSVSDSHLTEKFNSCGLSSGYGALVEKVNPLTPKSDQYRISSAASPEITPHSMKNLAFHSLLRWKTIILPITTTSPIHLYFFDLGVKWLTATTSEAKKSPSGWNTSVCKVNYVNNGSRNRYLTPAFLANSLQDSQRCTQTW